MYGKNFIRTGEMILTAVACLMLAGCGTDAQKGEETAAVEETGQAAGQSETAGETDGSTVFNESEKNTAEAVSSTEEEHILLPMEYQWQEGDMDYDPEDTIYYKTYYEDFVRGYIKHIEYPDINSKDEMEAYFRYEDDFEKWDNLVEMFFDYRTIEMPEEELKSLFYQHGYTLCFQSAEMKNLHVRFVEITEIGGLSLYPTRIMIQSWDENYIYLQDITSPIPRKIMGIFTIDNREPYRMVVHSSGVSRDYVDEQELSFWEYRGAYWALVPMELEIDTSHAHISGDLYPDLDRDELFEASYYRDGIAYLPSRQNKLPVDMVTVRLGKMETVEKNKSFRLMAVYDSEQLGVTEWPGDTYIQFKIKQDLPFIPRECRYNSGGIFLYYLQLSGMEDREKEQRINAMIYEDVMEIAERDEIAECDHLDSVYDYEITQMDERIIHILYKNRKGDAVAASTIDIEEETILASDSAKHAQ